MLFEVASKAINQVLGGKTGMVATLHSWGSNLAYHPHLHVIVAAGSYKNGKWQPSSPNNPRCFCNATELREQYKKLFLKKLLEVIEFEDLNWKGDSIESPEIFPKIKQIYHQIQRKKWTVRIENPVLGVEQIIEYLARYVRRVAITNSRIEQVTTDEVIINYKQYALQKKGQPPPIGKREFEGEKFIQQFAQHFMPRRFHKVRYYGFYAFGSKKLKVQIHQKLTGSPPCVYQKPSKKELIKKMLGQDLDLCTNCGVYNALRTELILATPSLIYSLTQGHTLPQIRAGPMPKIPLEAVVF